MNKNSVIKIISRFQESFNLHKASERKVLAEIVYEDFHQYYGLQKVAEGQFKRFLKAIRILEKASKEIRVFGEAMGVLEGKKGKEKEKEERKEGDAMV